ncbi:MAG: ABC transporter ATP-binding protein [Mailhella sp.]|nr:ABC transporter ATP-binding protein [Mailhella sp.]
MSALVGPDGAGKTTFLRMICGLLTPSAGRLTVLGLDPVREKRTIQARVGYMPQHFGLYEDLSVQENMKLYADLNDVPPEIRTERFARLLEMTDLKSFTDRPAGKLSGGMKQKLALACTLVRSPELLLLDEPSAGVDPLSRRELWEIITSMVQKEHISVLVSTAYMDEAERCSMIMILHEGHLLRCGSPEELKKLTDGLCRRATVPDSLSARTFQAMLLDNSDVIMDAVPEGANVRFVLTSPEIKTEEVLQSTVSLPLRCVPANPTLESSFMHLLKNVAKNTVTVQDKIKHAESCKADNNAAFNTLTAAAKKTSDAVTSLQQSEIVIEVRDLVRRFGTFTAVDKTSFEVRRGEVFGLLGPNGAGKTTTFRMLCGLLPATSGYLNVAGENLRSATAQARSRIGYVSQKFSLYGNLSVMENLRFFGGVYGLPPLILRQRIQEVLDQFELTGHENDISGSLPGGYKQRLAMAAGLLHRPEILFLDEPTSGIDPLARRMFWRQITSLAELGTTIVITTHFMEEAEYCDRMLIQDSGRMLALGTPSEVRRLGGNSSTIEEAFIHIVRQARAARMAAGDA